MNNSEGDNSIDIKDVEMGECVVIDGKNPHFQKNVRIAKISSFLLTKFYIGKLRKKIWDI